MSAQPIIPTKYYCVTVLQYGIGDTKCAGAGSPVGHYCTLGSTMNICYGGGPEMHIYYNGPWDTPDCPDC